ncbi:MULTISPECIES: transcription elongation factor GreAB [Maribacter]|uniref:Transcription elongation factor GreAB n=1 Tax=Maribacter flavus TaxID=1658664 RepID=A0ABU7IJB6_9FLAO|nr:MULTISPECIES: transcription elongation factor GreAB [Maribacter]MDC6405716.1 transcription elongation factor GreAB [Maribacter sp. PR66]MEE1973032.1 transcription elongation factor GreAB [Maribacter flavus]
MGKNVLIVEQKEYVLIKRAINLSIFIQDMTLKAILERYSVALETAKIISESDMPKNIIRINSKVTIEYPDGKLETFQLALPSELGINQNKLSIFTDKGALVFGRMEGISINSTSMQTSERFIIKEVRQRSNNIGLDMVL